MKSKEVPYSFILDELYPLDLIMKPMFGCQAFYKDDKLLFILRKKEDNKEDNGVWIATNSPEGRIELKKTLKSMRSLILFGTPDTAWQNIPEDSATFEEEVIEVCTLIKKGDPRIGKIPTKKKSKSAKGTTLKSGAAKPVSRADASKKKTPAKKSSSKKALAKKSAPKKTGRK